MSAGKKKRKHDLRKGQILRLTVESMASGGAGVAREGGVPVFVEGAAAGDLVEVELFDVRGDFARGHIVKIVNGAGCRREPVCEVFERCGGCQWQHMSYESQLIAKREIVVASLRHIGGMDAESIVDSTAGTVERLHYRNKAQYPVGLDSKRSLVTGYYEKGSHTIVDIDRCPVQPEELDRVLVSIKNAVKKEGLIPYDERTCKGLIRHILSRRSTSTGEILITLVVNRTGPNALTEEELTAIRSVTRAVGKEVREIAGFCLNFNTVRGNRIISDNTVCIQGSPIIEEVLISPRKGRPVRLREGLKFRLSSNSFFQIHTGQATFIYDEVFDFIAGMAGARTDLTIVDAYAGVGTIAMWLASLADLVIAVEENPHAVADGRGSLTLNGIDNVEFREGRAEEILPGLGADGIKPDIVVLDPPRKGANRKALDCTMSLAPDRIVYVSCNPATLARDLRILGGKHPHTGYKTLRVMPVDLFPQTSHVESIAVLERKMPHGVVGNLEKN